MDNMKFESNKFLLVLQENTMSSVGKKFENK
ncbi:Uncharacterised protein [Legionella gratiana]|uniref:Uncharacterized protein n=1 Tax=Legionella gratiana TaxID=45066 RepID=A0A378JEJ3_9GAMM|nr:Uncharacterised protein [Legionella gratiana]